MAINVYRFGNNVNKFKYFLPKNEIDRNFFKTYGSPFPQEMLSSQPEVELGGSKHKIGSFFNFDNNIIIVTVKTFKLIEGYLEECGQIIDFKYKSKEFKLINVTKVIDCLDKEKTDWITSPEGVRACPRNYVFIEDKLPKSGFFKIPETKRAEIFVKDSIPKADSLISLLTSSVIKGVVLDRVWHKP